jgi:hypothetical protein
MAANDPGLAQAAAEAYDPTREMVEETKDGMIEEERPVAPDQFDERYETSRWEIWAYYSYYIGNNGLTLCVEPLTLPCKCRNPASNPSQVYVCTMSVFDLP